MFLAALLLLPGSASPCSCAPKQGVSDELKLADAVFSAEVTKLEVLPSWWAEMGTQTNSELLEADPGETPIRVLKVTFTVMKAWKGVSEPVVVVRTIADCCICGSTFAIGLGYLVYAFRLRGDGTLWTNICSRTTNLDKAVEDLKELGPAAIDHEKRRADKGSGRGGGGS